MACCHPGLCGGVGFNIIELSAVKRPTQLGPGTNVGNIGISTNVGTDVPTEGGWRVLLSTPVKKTLQGHNSFQSFHRVFSKYDVGDKIASKIKIK